MAVEVFWNFTCYQETFNAISIKWVFFLRKRFNNVCETK